LKDIPVHRLKDMEYLGKNLPHMTDGLPILDSTKSLAF
jgi:hypothetical protein